MKNGPAQHDRLLFQALLEQARGIDPSVRGGSMFGCPAAYRGRKLAACVYGSGVGLKVPEAVAKSAIASGRAVPFTPYGKSQMREWIMIRPHEDGLDAYADLLEAALTYAEANDK